VEGVKCLKVERAIKVIRAVLSGEKREERAIFADK
jgi:hypothetical protein